MEYVLLACFGWGVRLYIYRGAALALGTFWGTLAYFIRGRDRAVALANLSIVLGETVSPKQKRRIVRETFRRLGRIVIGLFWAPRLKPADFQRLVDGDDFWATLRRLEERKKGVVLVTAHFGDWEMLCLATAAAGFPMMIITEPPANPRLSAIFDRLRSCTGNHAVPPKYAMLKLFRGLRRGERVGLVCDVNGRRGRGGVWVDFFGLQVFNGIALAELALRTNSAVVFAAAHPLPKGRMKIVCAEPVERKPTADHADDVQKLTQHVVHQHEALLRHDPAPWLWTYKRWKRKPTPDAAGYPSYARFNRVK